MDNGLRRFIYLTQEKKSRKNLIGCLMKKKYQERICY